MPEKMNINYDERIVEVNHERKPEVKMGIVGGQKPAESIVAPSEPVKKKNVASLLDDDDEVPPPPPVRPE